jgi:SAM-dependent methyltransferase
LGTNTNGAFYRALTKLLPPGGTLLDLACGDGAFLKEALAAGARSADGVEISQDGILSCVQAGLTVHHGDITEGLTSYPDQSFDCVSLIRSLELFPNPEPVIDEMLRVGKTALVTFTNFGHVSLGVRYLLTGVLPSNDPERLGGSPARITLPHLQRYCARAGIKLTRVESMPRTFCSSLCAEWFAEEIAVLLSRPYHASPAGAKVGGKNPEQLILKPLENGEKP